jgi:outer membrane lipoprotein-sorting protein
MRHLLLLIALLAASVVPAARADTVKTTEDLLRAMQKRYAGKWYKNVTFTQKTTEYQPDGTSKASIWYEALAMPGKLRIDFDPIKDGNGIMFINDTVYDIKGGKVEKSQPLVHPLLLLGFDAYFIPVEQTMTKLKEMGFDLSILREDTWQGKPVYVVGAQAGDLHSAQFWIDKKELYFVRMLQPAGKDKTRTSETQFNKYVKMKDGGWVAPEVIFMLDGKRRVLEEYTDIRTNVELDDKFFDPQSWTTATHWKK